MNNLDVYFYHFTHRATNHLWPEWLGVLHADEIQFVFGEPLLNASTFNEEEKVFTRKILKYWSNFARYDNPNGKSDQLGNNSPGSLRLISDTMNTFTLKQPIENWPKYEIIFSSQNDTQRAYIVLDADKIEVDYNLRADYCSFWNSYIPNLMLNEPQCDSQSSCSDDVKDKTRRFSSQASTLVSKKHSFNMKISYFFAIFFFINL